MAPTRAEELHLCGVRATPVYGQCSTHPPVWFQAELVGMIPVHRGQFQLLQPKAWSWSKRLKQCVAVCNGIVVVKNTLLGGSSLENSMFTAVGARFLVKTAPVVPYCDTLFQRSSKLQIV